MSGNVVRTGGNGREGRGSPFPLPYQEGAGGNGGEGGLHEGKKGESHRLTARERRFAHLVADPLDTRSIGDKGVACGWKDQKYGYKIMRREHVANEIERVVNEHLRALKVRVARVLSALADRAEDGDTQAARLFLEAAGLIGSGGVRINNAVSAVSTTAPGEAFVDRLRRLAEENTDEARARRIERVRNSRLGPADHGKA